MVSYETATALSILYVIFSLCFGLNAHVLLFFGALKFFEIPKPELKSSYEVKALNSISCNSLNMCKKLVLKCLRETGKPKYQFKCSRT